jgi:hypothetical protein
MLFVVARYNEDVSWTKKLKNVIICNKGEPLEESYNQIMMDNVGREGHTYYKYIVENYDSLDDHIVFLQGNPFEHSPNLFQVIKKITPEIDFTFLSELLFITNLNAQMITYQQCYYIDKTYKQVFSEDPDKQTLFFGTGAQFAVTKNIILKHTKEYYSNIVQILQYDINPIEGHHIERFHYHIFMGTENKMDIMEFNKFMTWINYTSIYRIFNNQDGVPYLKG